MFSSIFKNRQLKSHQLNHEAFAEFELLKTEVNKDKVVIELNSHGEITAVNDNFCKALGYSSDEVRGQHYRRITSSPEAGNAHSESFWPQLQAGNAQAGTFNLAGKNGTSLWFQGHYTPIWNSHDNCLHKVVGYLANMAKEEKPDAREAYEALSSTFGIAEISIDGFFIQVNPLLLALLGYQEEDLLDKPVTSFIKDQPAGLQAFKEIKNALTKGEVTTIEVCRIAKSGKELWLQETYIPLLDSEKRGTKALIQAADITQEKIAATALKGKLDAIERSQAMIEFDPSGIILEINDHFTKVMGYKREDILGKHHSILVSPEYKNSPDYKKFWESLADGRFVNGVYQRFGKNRQEVWLQASYNPLIGMDGKVTQIVKYAIDATQSVTREKEQSQKSLEATMIKNALESSSNNLMVANKDGVITYMNPATLTLMREAAPIFKTLFPHFNPDKLIGQSFDVFHKNPAHQRNLLAGLKGKHITEIPVGNMFFRLTANPIFDEHGERLGSVVEWVDLSQEKLVQTQIQEALDAAVAGDISFILDQSKAKGASVHTMEGINALLGIMNEVLQKVQGAVETINTAANEISAGNNDLSTRTEAQASNLEETASSMEELAATVKQNADNAKLAFQMVEAASGVASRGGEMVASVVTTMGVINESAQKIEDIISVIDGIAFQTNILALNAAVEAARAGEQGRGFAVVAGEVRNLAQRSATAAKEIKQLITDSVSKTAEGARLVDSTGETMREIVSSVRQVTDIMSEITAASAEQSTGIAQVNEAVTHMDEVTQQNAALVEEAAAASESLVKQANSLMQTIGKFKLRPVATLPANVKKFSKHR